MPAAAILKRQARRVSTLTAGQGGSIGEYTARNSTKTGIVPALLQRQAPNLQFLPGVSQLEFSNLRCKQMAPGAPSAFVVLEMVRLRLNRNRESCCTQCPYFTHTIDFRDFLTHFECIVGDLNCRLSRELSHQETAALST